MSDDLKALIDVKDAFLKAAAELAQLPPTAAAWQAFYGKLNAQTGAFLGPAERLIAKAPEWSFADAGLQNLIESFLNASKGGGGDPPAAPSWGSSGSMFSSSSSGGP